MAHYILAEVPELDAIVQLYAAETQDRAEVRHTVYIMEQEILRLMEKFTKRGTLRLMDLVGEDVMCTLKILLGNTIIIQKPIAVLVNRA